MKRPTPQALADGLRSGDRIALARAITLIESTHAADQKAADELFDLLPSPREPVFRLGITGAPGAGKSSIIEALGLRLCDAGRRIAVLAIDPSSPVSGGSLLGDKTRMSGLSQHPAAYVRPSPAANLLGGLSAASCSAVRLCEAAGYDFIIIETVGTGQSERQITDIADGVLLLIDPGGGDGLQATKRGLIECADWIVVTKADGDLRYQAEQTLAEFMNAPATHVSRLPGRIREHLLVSIHDVNLLGAVQQSLANYELRAQPWMADWRCIQARAQFDIALQQAAIEWLRSHPLSATRATEYAQAWPQLGLPSTAARRVLEQMLGTDLGQ
jgi:LAO/AO transport system kinase